MKKTFAALMLVGIFSLPAMAQPEQKKSPEKQANKMTETMSKQLELTPDQKKSVYKANLEMTKSMRESKTAIRNAHEAEMKEILSDEQFAKMEQMQKEHKKGGKPKRMKSSGHRHANPNKDKEM